MPFMIIDDATYRSLCNDCGATMVAQAARAADGMWHITIPDEFKAALDDIRRAAGGTDDSGAIRLLIGFHRGKQEGRHRGATHRGLR